jgi:hypothetical protein
VTRRILKFTVQPGTTWIDTADEPRWLAVGAQGSHVVAWCEATPGTGHTDMLGAVMTGQAPPDGATYVGTTTQADGIVVHVYIGRAAS